EAQIHTDIHVDVAQGDDVDEHDRIGDGGAVDLRSERRAGPQALVEREVDSHVGLSQLFDKENPVEPSRKEREQGDEAWLPRRHGDLTECIEFGCAFHRLWSPHDAPLINSPCPSYHRASKGQMSIPADDNL